MRSHKIATPLGEPLTPEDVIDEISERLVSLAVTNKDDESVYPVEVAPIKGTTTIELVMSDDSKFIIEIKSKDN